MYSPSMLKQVVRIVTTGVQMFNNHRRKNLKSHTD
jgi:hypothetical protein